MLRLQRYKCILHAIHYRVTLTQTLRYTRYAYKATFTYTSWLATVINICISRFGNVSASTYLEYWSKLEINFRPTSKSDSHPHLGSSITANLGLKDAIAINARIISPVHVNAFKNVITTAEASISVWTNEVKHVLPAKDVDLQTRLCDRVWRTTWYWVVVYVVSVRTNFVSAIQH